MNVLKSSDEVLCTLDIRLLEGKGDDPSGRRGPELADDKEGVKGRDWMGVEAVLDAGDCDSDVG